jgi:endonuclease YncB( thermonuclease family)
VKFRGDVTRLTFTRLWVYLRNGTFVNVETIKQGYGFAYTRFPFQYMEEFRRYEREARENERGLWGEWWL